MISPAWVRSSSPDDHPARQPVGQLLRALDRVVVGDAQHVDARQSATASLELVGRRRRVARPHRVAVQVDPDPAGGHRRGEVRVPSDRVRCGPTPGREATGSPRRGQAPLMVTSRMTSVTPAALIGSQSTSPPTATTSCSIRCSVEAMVNSRTGSAELRRRVITQARGAGGEVAADRVDARVQARHRLDEHAVVDVGDQLGLRRACRARSDRARQPHAGRAT